MAEMKSSIIKRILNLLEDPKYPSVGPHLHLLGFTGLWHPNITQLTKFKQVLFYITVSYFFSQYVKCCINPSGDALKLILQYTPFHLGILKACFFQKDHKRWEDLIAYASSVERDQLSKKEKSFDSIIKGYISYNRKVSYFFWALAFFSNVSIFSEPYQKNQIVDNGTSVYVYIFDGYTPFKKEPPGYYVSMFVQTVLGHVVSAYVVGWDTLVVAIMIFFAGQLKMARLFCTQVVDENNIQSRQNIAEFHRYYIKLVKYQKQFNSLISPVMFVYLIVISTNLGVCIIQMVQLQDDLATLLSSCSFVVATLIQLLLFYWHSNVVTVESALVSYGIFESDWTRSDKNVLKEVALISITTTKRLAFRAGPFNEMSLATFIAILRASYSFYTLLNETN